MLCHHSRYTRLNYCCTYCTGILVVTRRCCYFSVPRVQVAMLYMFTRLVVNISQIYIPMYVSGSLQLAKHYIAVIPLVMFVSSFLTSFIMKPVNALIGRKATYFIGSMLVVASCCWMWFLSKHNGLLVIGSSILLGAGCSTILVTSLSITADLIGTHSVSDES